MYCEINYYPLKFTGHSTIKLIGIQSGFFARTNNFIFLELMKLNMVGMAGFQLQNDLKM